MKIKIFNKIHSLIKLKKDFFLLTNVLNHTQYVFEENDLNIIPEDINLSDLEKKIKSRQNGMLNEVWFIKFFSQKLKVIINGAVHITQALAPMCRICNYDVIILDPRNIFANSKRFPEENIINTWSNDYLIKNPLDKHTAVVTLTHDPKIDDPIIKLALEKKCFYISCLGSIKTHKARKERLRKFGFSDNDLDNLNGPAGLDINAKSPEEIAVSILAELIMFTRMKK